MDRIEVTDEMRARILNSLRKVDFTKPDQTKVLRFSSVKKYLSVAAFFAFLLAGLLTLPGLLVRGPQRPAGVLNPGAGIVEAATLGELSGMVNLKVPEGAGLPFPPEKQSGTAFGKNMAQITCEGMDRPVPSGNLLAERTIPAITTPVPQLR